MTRESSLQASHHGFSISITTPQSPRTSISQKLSDRVTTFCDRIYTFFRWAVTDDFLTAFGAKK